jgi:hypothetical protein
MLPGYVNVSSSRCSAYSTIRHGQDRLKQVLRMVREWRHLKALKRAGRGHEPGGPAATKLGELCARCPACPRPGVNLPDGWRDASDDIKFIYTLVVAIDANFRLKRRAVSSNERDPALGDGWGYFVEDKPYLDYVLKHADQEDVSHVRIRLSMQR